MTRNPNIRLGGAEMVSAKDQGDKADNHYFQLLKSGTPSERQGLLRFLIEHKDLEISDSVKPGIEAHVFLAREAIGQAYREGVISTDVLDEIKLDEEDKSEEAKELTPEVKEIKGVLEGETFEIIPRTVEQIEAEMPNSISDRMTSPGMDMSMIGFENMLRIKEKEPGMGVVYPPLKRGSFIIGFHLPSPTGYASIISTRDEVTAANRRTLEIVSHTRRDDEIEITMDIRRGDMIASPINSEVIGVADNKIHVVEGTGVDSGRYYSTSTEFEATFRVRKKDFSLSTEVVLELQPTEDEMKFWRSIVPLPDRLYDYCVSNPKAAPQAIAAHMRKNYHYYTGVSLGEFYNTQGPDMGQAIAAVGMGNCKTLSWVASAYLRQVGMPAVVTLELCTTQSGEGISEIGHAKVVFFDVETGKPTTFDPSEFCEAATGLINKFPEKDFKEALALYDLEQDPERRIEILRELQLKLIEIHETNKKEDEDAPLVAPESEDVFEGHDNVVDDFQPLNFYEKKVYLGVDTTSSEPKVEGKDSVEARNRELESLVEELYAYKREINQFIGSNNSGGESLVSLLMEHSSFFNKDEWENLQRIFDQIGALGIDVFDIIDKSPQELMMLLGYNLEEDSFTRSSGTKIMEGSFLRFGILNGEVPNYVSDDIISGIIGRRYEIIDDKYRWYEPNLSSQRDFWIRQARELDFGHEVEEYVRQSFSDLMESGEIDGIVIEEALDNAIQLLTSNEKDVRVFNNLMFEFFVLFAQVSLALVDREVRERLSSRLGFTHQMWSELSRDTISINDKRKRKQIRATAIGIEKVVGTEVTEGDYPKKVRETFEINREDRKKIYSEFMKVLESTQAKSQADLEYGDPEIYDPSIHTPTDIVWSLTSKRTDGVAIARRKKSSPRGEKPIYVFLDFEKFSFRNPKERLIHEIHMEAARDFVRKRRIPVHVTSSEIDTYFEVMPNTRPDKLSDALLLGESDESAGLLPRGKKRIPEEMIYIAKNFVSAGVARRYLPKSAIILDATKIEEDVHVGLKRRGV